MSREDMDELRRLYTETRDEARAEAVRLRASAEEFSRGGVDLKPGEIARQEQIAAEYDSLLEQLVE